MNWIFIEKHDQGKSGNLNNINYIILNIFCHIIVNNRLDVYCMHHFLSEIKLNECWFDGTLVTLGKPIMMFRVNLINYLVKLHLKCINEYCIRISEILCILKCVVMIDMKTRHILFW